MIAIKLLLYLLVTALCILLIWAVLSYQERRCIYDKCYKRMKDEGIAAHSCCCGSFGGDKHTNYLSYSCMRCPYLVLVRKEKKE